jgi:hypothetical protein
VQDLIVQLRDALAAGGDSTFATVLAVVIILALLLIVVVALFIVRMYTPRGRVDLLLESGTRGQGAGPWVTRGIVLATIALLLGGVTLYAERPASCQSCHQETAYTEVLEASAHAEVGCVRCHRQSGSLSRVRDAVRYSGWLWSYYVEENTIGPGDGSFIDSRSCLSCHRTILDETVTAGGIRVRHIDFIDEGEACVNCHGDVGHSQARGAQSQAVMNRCLQCHNGTDESSACDVCHVEDLGVRVASLRGGQLGTIGFTSTGDCYGCHDPQPCTDCHGVIMPHPEDWSYPISAELRAGGRFLSGPGSSFPPGTHVRDGFANREVCWRCHFEGDNVLEPSEASCWCHGELGYYHGGPAWIREHGLQATGQKAGASSNCGQCHGPPEVFCTWCHTPDYASRYAPVYGPDNFTPTPGYTIGDPRDP